MKELTNIHVNNYSENGQEQKMGSFQVFLGVNLCKLKAEIRIGGSFLLRVFTM